MGRTSRVDKLAPGLVIVTTSVGIPLPLLAAGFGDASEVQISWWRVIGALAFCLMIEVGAIYALKGRQGGAGLRDWARFWPPNLGKAVQRLGQSDRRLKLVETVRLSHQVDICLLDCTDLEVGVAVSPHGATLLFTRPKAPGATVSDTAGTGL